MDNKKANEYVFVVYDYIGKEYAENFHQHSDWILFYNVTQLQAFNSFWEDTFFNDIKRRQRRKDFRITKILCFDNKHDKDKFVDDYWKNPPPMGVEEA